MVNQRNMNTIVKLLFVVVATKQVTSFSTTPIDYTSINGAHNSPTNPFQQQTLSGIHFQLEELEDAETSTTEVILNDDLTVSLGETDGPRYISSEGSWTDNYIGDEDWKFTMKLTRTFVSGDDNQESQSTNIGEFQYSVERTYTGEVFLVGGAVLAMNGEILDIDEIFGERRVGFFNMIDTTEERKVINAPV